MLTVVSSGQDETRFKHRDGFELAAAVLTSLLLNGIEPTGVERVTFQKPKAGPPQSPQNPVSLDRLTGIMGTGRLKPTGWRKQGGNPSLIQPNQAEAELSHRWSNSTIINPSCRRAAFQAS